MYCEQRLSRGQIARQYGANVNAVTRQLVAAGVTFEERIGINPNAGRTPERQAEINAKVSASRQGKGTGPRVQHEIRVCQNDECGTSYEYRPGQTGAKFCSKSCQMSVQGRKTAEEAQREYAESPRRCPCGTGITYEFRHSRQFCSSECRSKHGVKRLPDPENHATFSCLNCGTEVTRRKGLGYHKYCSNACAVKHTKTKEHIVVDNAVVLDSTWEALFWGLCGFRKIPVERFDRESGVAWREESWYAPDFWLPHFGLAVEVKGVEDTDDAEKWTAFRAKFPLIVLGRDELDALCGTKELPATLLLIAEAQKQTLTSKESP
jgi:hypothetical protein